MPLAGGQSEKLGNRYEAVWTVDSLLDVLCGDAESVTVEPFEEEADGIEFIKVLANGTRESHSAKRQTTGNLTPKMPLSRTGPVLLGFSRVIRFLPGFAQSFRTESELQDAESRPPRPGNPKTRRHLFPDNPALELRYCHQDTELKPARRVVVARVDSLACANQGDPVAAELPDHLRQS